jgi:hypothetical protein
MILRTIAFVLPLLGGDLPEVDPRPLVRKVAVEKKVPERARAERTQTLEARREFRHRRHVVRVEAEARHDAEEAPVQPAPVLGAPSTGVSTYISIPVHVIAGGGGPGAGPSPMVGIPAMAGQLPPGWTQVYGPLLRRFQDSGL